jgi:hypothetical protein
MIEITKNNSIAIRNQTNSMIKSDFSKVQLNN